MNSDIYNIAENYKQVLESKQPTKEQLQATKKYLKAFGLPSDDITVSQISQNSLQMKMQGNTQRRMNQGTSNYKEVLGQLTGITQGANDYQNQAQSNTEIPITGPAGINPGFSATIQKQQSHTGEGGTVPTHTPYYLKTYQFPDLPETIEDEPGKPRSDHFNRSQATADDIFNIFKSAFGP